MEVFGKIRLIGPVMQVSTSFKKRELVVSTDEQYPQHLMIEFNQDRCDLLNNFQVGQPVKVSINLRGREWINPQGETKYFNQINGWKIEAQNAATAPAPPPAQEPTYDATLYNPEDDHDDLPF